MTLTLDWPPELESHLREQDPALDESAAKEARIAVALDWFRKEKISSGRLAELIGISRWEIDGWLNDRGEMAQTLTHEDIQQDVETLERASTPVRRL